MNNSTLKIVVIGAVASVLAAFVYDRFFNKNASNTAKNSTYQNTNFDTNPYLNNNKVTYL